MKLKANQKLIYRAACVFHNEGKVLLHRAEMDDFFALPGGSVEFGESSAEAIEREMKEELGATVKVDRLLWVAENFFEYQDKECQEIGLYYLTTFTGESMKFYNSEKFDGIESEFMTDQSFKLHFEWISQSSLKNLNIKPTFLKTSLMEFPKLTEIKVNRDSWK